MGLRMMIHTHTHIYTHAAPSRGVDGDDNDTYDSIDEGTVLGDDVA